MRGMANVITAAFSVAAILIAVYLAIHAHITYTEKIAEAAKIAVQRATYASYVEYSSGECNSASGELDINYTGNVPEYAVRVLCYNTDDPPNTVCIVPEINSGAKSLQYVGRDIPGTIELNLSACEGLNTACYLEKLRCVAIGTYSARRIYVNKVQ